MATLILSGVPGSMCREIAQLARTSPWTDKHTIAPFAIGSPRRAGGVVELVPGLSLKMIGISDLARTVEDAGIRDAIVVDYTIPDGALGNIRVYCDAGIPFVMGTTGFDREEARRLVEAAGLGAVLSPNMAPPIILLQSALGHLAREFPGALAGWKLTIRESHQAGKKDVSGTARAFLPMLEALGSTAGEPPIEAIRDQTTQEKLRVPGEHLGGHGWHWYELVSPDGSGAVDFSHRVNGRGIYATGTLLAVEFLERILHEKCEKGLFPMEDVLRRLPGES